MLNIKGFLTVGIMSCLFIVFAKVIFTKYDVPGISKVVQAV